MATEDASSHGRLDLRLRFNGQLWLFELKVVELAPEGTALQQIKDKGYADFGAGVPSWARWNRCACSTLHPIAWAVSTCPHGVP